MQRFLHAFQAFLERAKQGARLDSDYMRSQSNYYAYLILQVVIVFDALMLLVLLFVDVQFSPFVTYLIFGLLVYFIILYVFYSRLSQMVLSYLILGAMYVAILFIYYLSPNLHPAQVLSFFVIVAYIGGRMLTRYGLGVVTVVLITTMLALWEYGYSQHELLPTTFFVVLSCATIWFATLLRQTTLEQLLESESRYKDLMEAAFEPIIITTSDAAILDCNIAFEKLMGYAIQEVKGHYMLEYVAPSQRPRVARFWFTRKQIPYDVQVIHKGGQVLEVEVTTRPHSYMGKPAYVTMVRDMTEQRHIESARRENELRYQALFETTSDAVLIIAMDGHVLTCNEQTQVITGYTIDEIKRMTYRDIVIEEELPQANNVLERLLNGERLPPYVRRIRHKNGHTIKVEISIMLVRDTHNNPVYLQSIYRDVTERERLIEERFTIAIQNERMLLLRQLIDEFSHYVRTPLTSVKNARYLLSRTSDPDKRNAYLTMIDRETDRITNLLNDLLLLVRVDVQIEQREAMNANTIAKMLMPAPLGMKPPDEHHTYDFEGTEEGAMIYGNRLALMEAITRLMDNAKAYTPMGGKIAVSVQRQAQKVLIKVQDEGVGIPQDALPYIFENFYRTDTARHMASSSSGLGLSIAQRIVQLHNGVVSVESSEGKGSTFTITLPSIVVAETS